MSAAGEDTLPTPFFLIDEARLLRNLNLIAALRARSEVKVLLALKCFSTWGVFELMRPFLDGTTANSLFEARLGRETLGGETHVYAVAFSPDEVGLVDAVADRIIFNSASQLLTHAASLRRCRSVGLRLNPGVGHAVQTLADPVRRYSRLGALPRDLTDEVRAALDGYMLHFNCENADADRLLAMFDRLSRDLGAEFDRVDWVSLGGGMLLTAEGFALDRFADALRCFADRHGVTVYLEPGEAVVSRTTDLVVTVLDVVENERLTAVVDSSAEAHRLDTLIYDEPASVREAERDGPFEYFVGGNSGLAGDVFCSARFARPLVPGDRLHLLDSAGYTMVKLSWFNGLRMPSVQLRRTSGRIEQLNAFGYEDFRRMGSLRSVSVDRVPPPARAGAGGSGR